MKIFAKRTRKALDPETAKEQVEAQKEREAVKAVKELLKLDPSTLNAKQRRMIKRYKNRTQTEEPTKEQKDETAAKPSLEQEETSEENDTKEALSDSDEESSSSDSKEENANDDEDDADGNGEEGTPHVAESNAASAGSKTVSEEELKKLLEQLNSKQRRKLARRLEREGSGVIVEVHEEALRLLAEAEKTATPNSTKDATTSQESVKQEVASSGKRKRKKDWSDLAPEERLRREEQRRLQQEAAERRAKEGPSTSKKKRHPLNSERRRANRRKPKWEQKKRVDTNEHNSSGYHMRKITRGDNS